MTELLHNLVESSEVTYLTAFLLGLVIAISPCPLATNITATAYLSKDIASKKRVFLNGMSYMLGTILSYSLLGIIFYFGLSRFQIARFLQQIGGVWFGVALVIVGILLLDVVRYNFPGINRAVSRFGEKQKKQNYLNAFLMGFIFALAFCPYSGIIYFGVLMPMTIASPSGLLLPPIFAVAAGLPVIVVSWILAYSIGSIGVFYNNIKQVQLWFKRIVAATFIVAGAYYIYLNI